MPAKNLTKVSDNRSSQDIGKLYEDSVLHRNPIAISKVIAIRDIAITKVYCTSKAGAQQPMKPYR